MAGTLLSKIIGALCIAGLLAFAVGMLGDSLVTPGKQVESGTVASATPSRKIPKKAEEKTDPIGPLLAAAKVDAGSRQANKCSACHTLKKGDNTKKLGPPLWDVVGRKAGKLEGYSFSKAMAEMSGNWDYEALNQFIFKPKGYLRGTKMGFAGIGKATDRADLIAFLRSLSDQPVPLP